MNKKRLLPKSRWRLKRDGDVLLAGIYEYPEGVLYTVKVAMSALPDDLISADDLKCHGVDLVDGVA